MSISLEGISTVSGAETRAVALLKVTHNNQVYDWQIYVPADVDLPSFIASMEASVKAEIDAKEAEWAALTPKTKEIQVLGGETTTVDIEKTEIVRPEIPDYYAKRRDAYPPLGEQFDAMWKGGQEAADMLAKVQAVKAKYPKPSWLD